MQHEPVSQIVPQVVIGGFRFGGARNAPLMLAHSSVFIRSHLESHVPDPHSPKSHNRRHREGELPPSTGTQRSPLAQSASTVHTPFDELSHDM